MNNKCNFCVHDGKWDNEIMQGYECPCLFCRYRDKYLEDNFESVFSKNENNLKGYKTLIISAFPCCGKSYATKHYDMIKPCEPFYDSNTNRKIYPGLEERDIIKSNEIIDLESSDFSWIYNGNEKERNKDFPKNYIEKLKELIGTVKIIFVSSHKIVREAMIEAGIEYITVYPSFHAKAEWLGRMIERGDDLEFIKDQNKHWDERVLNIQNEAHGKGVYLLSGANGTIINLLNNAVVSVEYEKRKYDESTTSPVGHHINLCINDWIYKK